MSQSSNFLTRLNPLALNYGICRADWQPYLVQLSIKQQLIDAQPFTCKATGSAGFALWFILVRRGTWYSSPHPKK